MRRETIARVFQDRRSWHGPAGGNRDELQRVGDSARLRGCLAPMIGASPNLFLHYAPTLFKPRALAPQHTHRHFSPANACASNTPK